MTVETGHPAEMENQELREHMFHGLEAALEDITKLPRPDQDHFLAALARIENELQGGGADAVPIYNKFVGELRMVLQKLGMPDRDLE